MNGAGQIGCEYIFDFFIHCLVLISFSCITTTSRLSQYGVSNPVCFTVLNIHSILDQITSSPVDHIESLAGLSNWHTRTIARFWGRWYVNEIRRLFPSEDYGWWYLDRHCWVMCRTNKYPRNVNVCMGTLPIVNFHLQWWNDPDGQCLKARCGDYPIRVLISISSPSWLASLRTAFRSGLVVKSKKLLWFDNYTLYLGPFICSENRAHSVTCSTTRWPVMIKGIAK